MERVFFQFAKIFGRAAESRKNRNSFIKVRDKIIRGKKPFKGIFQNWGFHSMPCDATNHNTTVWGAPNHYRVSHHCYPWPFQGLRVCPFPFLNPHKIFPCFCVLNKQFHSMLYSNLYSKGYVGGETLLQYHFQLQKLLCCGLWRIPGDYRWTHCSVQQILFWSKRLDKIQTQILGFSLLIKYFHYFQSPHHSFPIKTKCTVIIMPQITSPLPFCTFHHVALWVSTINVLY